MESTVGSTLRGPDSVGTVSDVEAPEKFAKCRTCGLNVYGLDHEAGCPLRLGGLPLEDDGFIMEVVWHGATPDKWGGHTKGELTGPYNKPRRT